MGRRACTTAEVAVDAARAGFSRKTCTSSKPEHFTTWACADASLRGGFRGLGVCTLRAQVTTLARLNDEIAADCWRLWLDGADAPDPRPWADILAAGDNKRVVKAERVAFLDWQCPGRDGKPARRLWPQAQWPDLRAMPGPQELREAA